MRSSWRPVLVFCLLAFGLSWLICLPLWLGGGLTSPLFMVCSLAMMATPGISALIVVRFIEKRPIASTLGLRPRTGAVSTLIWLAIAFVAVVLVVIAALATSAAFGVYTFDLVGLSGFREIYQAQLDAQGVSIDELGMSLRMIWLLQFVNIAVGSVINTVPALGEELGWRGYLFPRLRDLLGPAGAVLVLGIIWGVWHAPLILLGYNYPTNPPLGVLAMIVPSIGLGALLAWLTERGGSVWQAALGHGTYNAAVGGFLVMFGTAGQQVNTFEASVMGWAGWPVWAVVVAVLLLTGALRRPAQNIGRDSVSTTT